MKIILQSLVNHVLIIELNSRKTVYLAPGESSSLIDELEITGNNKVAKLLRTSLIKATRVPPEIIMITEPSEESEKVAAEQPEAKPEKKLDEPEMKPEEPDRKAEEPAKTPKKTSKKQ